MKKEGSRHTEAQHSWEQEKEEVSFPHGEKKIKENWKTNKESGESSAHNREDTDLQTTIKQQVSEFMLGLVEDVV